MADDETPKNRLNPNPGDDMDQMVAQLNTVMGGLMGQLGSLGHGTEPEPSKVGKTALTVGLLLSVYLVVVTAILTLVVLGVADLYGVI